MLVKKDYATQKRNIYYGKAQVIPFVVKPSSEIPIVNIEV